MESGRRDGRRRNKLGDYGVLTPDAARRAAMQKLAAIVGGENPFERAEEKAVTLTFAKWVDDYLERVRATKKHPREDERYLARSVERWGERPITEISTDDVERAFSEESEKVSTVTANRWLASLRACLQAAWRREHVAQNVAMRVKQFPEGAPRAETLNDKEFDKFVKAVRRLKDPHVRTAFTMLVETGARLSEVLHCRWDDLNLNQLTWRIPSTKSGKPQTIPLTPSMAAMLRRLPHVGDYVIAGRDPDKPRVDLKGPWEQLKEDVGIDHLRLHDIRRTFGLHVARSSGLHVASKLLRHSDIRVTEAHYAPLGIDELRDALVQREADIRPRRKKGKSKKRTTAT